MDGIAVQRAQQRRGTVAYPDVKRIAKPPQQLRIVHGDDEAKATLATLIRSQQLAAEMVVP